MLSLFKLIHNSSAALRLQFKLFQYKSFYVHNLVSVSALHRKNKPIKCKAQERGIICIYRGCTLRQFIVTKLYPLQAKMKKGQKNKNDLLQGEMYAHLIILLFTIAEFEHLRHNVNMCFFVKF